MPGTNQRVLPKRLYDFSKVANSESQDVVIVKALPIQQWREMLLIVRLHDRSGSSWNSGQQITVHLQAEAYTDEDPNTDFVYGTDLASIIIGDTTPAPSVQVAAASFIGNYSNYGGYVRVVLTGTQSSGGGTMQANVSIDLSLKA